MTVKEKILSYLETTGKVKAEFYKAIGASPSNFKGAGKNSALSSDKIAVILQLYPDLSPDWLLNGVGDMLRTANNTNITTTLQQPPTLEDKLLTIINDRETTIRLQAEEIGQLKERIRQLEQRLGKDAASVSTAITANVG
ncbi:MAG: hypothetical protein HDS81_07600 [Bacteroidales bacterium]|nr:hypothetical protein [Bacteroidales bacterium]